MPADRTLEPFVASGLPLHTRTLTVEAFRAEGGRMRVEGRRSSTHCSISHPA